MRSFFADADPSAVFEARAGEFDFAEDPGIAELHRLAGAVMELLGPVFWAALIVLLIQAALIPVAGG